MNLKLHALMAQLASLNADLESHGGVNSFFEDKFSGKLLGGLYDSISPTVEVPILELAAALDTEHASPFANVEIQEEVHLEENSEEDTMTHETILEVREACVSADLEVEALTAQLASLSVELELSDVADEMLINSEEELMLECTKTFVIEDAFIFPTVELLASDVSHSLVVGFDIRQDVEEGHGDVEDQDSDAINGLTSDVKEGDVDLEDEEGRGPMSGSTSDVKDGVVDLEEGGRGAMNDWTFDVKEGNIDPGMRRVDPRDEEGRGAMNVRLGDEKEGDVNLEDENRGALNVWASDVREGNVGSEGGEEDQSIMNDWIGDVKDHDIDSEDEEHQGIINNWTQDVKEGDVLSHIEFGGCGPGGGFNVPIGGRSIGFANRHPLSDGARRLQYSNRVYNRKPQGHAYSRTYMPNNYRHGGYDGPQSGGGFGDGRWSSRLKSGFLPYGSDDVGCSSYSSYLGYLRDERYFRGKTRYSGCSREGRNFGGKTRVWRRV